MVSEGVMGSWIFLLLQASERSFVRGLTAAPTERWPHVGKSGFLGTIQRKKFQGFGE